MHRQPASKRGYAADWTRERIEQLSPEEIKQLRANAERLGESGLATLCEDMLKERPRAAAKARASQGPPTRARRLIPRIKAFAARGIWLQDPRTSWGGIRKPDGAVVMALWAEAIESSDGHCNYLLWAPNIDGARPWSDKAGGKERLEHCKRAMTLGRAEGLLVYGQRLEGLLPEDRAHAIHGVDAETVVVFKVEMRGPEYWAVWGRKSA